MARKVEYTSYGSRLVQSIKGVLAGIVFFLAAFVVLFWNEGRAVRTAKGLEEGRRTCVEAAPDRLDPGMNGKLVHLAGPATTETVLRDPQFGVAIQALKLERRVRMYQWIESEQRKTEKQMGGGTKTVTTYSYRKDWDTTWHDSSAFYEKQTPANPRMPVESANWVAEPVRLGAYTLPRSLLQRLAATDELPVNEADGASPPSGYRIDQAVFHRGADPAEPQIGDVQVSYRVLRPTEVSLLAQRSGATFEPYVTAQGTTIFVIERGVLSAAALFQGEMRANTILTWVLRLGGFLMMAFGLGLVFQPLATVGDVVPLIGSILGSGVAIVSLLAALMLSCITVGVAWLSYRPVVGAGLLAGAAVVLVLGILRRRRARTSVAAAA